MKRIKKVFLVLVTLVCVLGLSVSSLAYNKVSPSSVGFLVKSEDYWKFAFTFPASGLNDADLSVWKHFVDVYQGGGTSEFALITYQTTSAVRNLYFVVFASDYTYSQGPLGCTAVYPVSPSDGFKVALNSSNRITSVSRLNQSNFNISDSSDGSFSAGIVRGASYLNSLPAVANVVDVGTLALDDDIVDDNPTPPQPDEPDESVPDIPPAPPYNPTPPVVPKGNEYVFYDTDVWNTAIGHIKKNVGSATNIGLLIFVFILVWSIFTRIFRHYTKPS